MISRSRYSYTEQRQEVDAPEGRGVGSRHRSTVNLVCGAILGALLVIYLAGCVFFATHLFPNTTVRGVDVSLMTASNAAQAISDALDQTSVHVSGDGVDFTLDSDSTGFSINADDAVDAMFEDVVVWAWPVLVMVDHNESAKLASSYDAQAIRSSVDAQVASFNATASDPVDASVSYSEDAGRFIVNPGSLGTKIDVDTVTSQVIDTLAQDSSSLTLTSTSLVQQGVTADDPALVSAAAQANAYLACDINYTLNGTTIATEDASVIKDWISVDASGQVTVDETAMTTWASELESKLNSVGGTVTYTRPDGKVVTVSGGTYGWSVDNGILEAMVRDTVYNSYTGDQELPMTQTAAVYNPGGQSWGKRYIDVDISEQHVRFYDSDGSLIWESDCITGANYDNRDTPTGVYSINNKQTNTTLIGANDPTTGQPSYKTPVSYWMPFIGNTVGLHDASWQPGFGGTLYQQGYGSHGCVNLPSDAAAQLYELVQIGDVVVVHN